MRVFDRPARRVEVQVIAVADAPAVGAQAPGQQHRAERVVVFDKQAEIGIGPAGKAAAIGCRYDLPAGLPAEASSQTYAMLLGNPADAM